VPLRALGTGSSRLMAAGLQAKAASKVPVLLVDEIEHGSEPHRIARLLHQLGSKTLPVPQQVFLTTHSPVVLRELSADQIWISRARAGETMKLPAQFSPSREFPRADAAAILAMREDRHRWRA
jgi:putative ATP-dependent endonuclease of the OLD family